MKKLMLSLVMVMATLAAVAQNLTIRTDSYNSRFWLYIDNILQNEYSVSSITVTNLRATSCVIRVEMEGREAFSCGRRVMLNNGNNTYRIYRNNNGITLQAIGSSRQTVDLLMPFLAPNTNAYGGYCDYTYGVSHSGHTYTHQGTRHEIYNTYNGNNYNNNHNGHGQYDNQVRPGNVGTRPAAGTARPVNGGIDHNFFNRMMEQLRNESFDSRRMEIAKQMIAGNGVNTDQLAAIARLFSFDSNRLDFLKWAYDYCTDKQHYAILTSEFTFGSNADELLRFLGQK